MSCSNFSTCTSIKGVIFDLGNTLTFRTKKFHEKEAMIKMANLIAKHCNWTDEKTEKFYQKYYEYYVNVFKLEKDYIGTWTILDPGASDELPMRNIIYTVFKMLKEDSGILNDKILKEATDIMRIPGDRFELGEGVHDVLSHLKKDLNMRLALVSNQYDGERQAEIIELFNLAQYFDCISISANTKHRKPDVRILNEVFEKWKDLRRSEIVVVGDKKRADILLAKYANLRSVLFDTKFKSFKVLPATDKSLLNLTTFHVKHGSYIVTSSSFSEDLPQKLGYLNPDARITSLRELPNVLATLSKTPYTMRPLRVGVYILPHKMEKLQSKGVFEVPYRHDIQLHFVDLFRPLEEQGPFDILVHKLASWYVAARTEPEVNRQLKECFQLMKSCQTNLDFERYPYSFDLEKNNELDVLNETNNCIKETSKSKSENETEHAIVVEDSNANVNVNVNANANANINTNGNHNDNAKKICETSSLSPSPSPSPPRHHMYVLDHPFAAFRTTDRWHIYNTLRNAHLEYESKEDKDLFITFSSPRSLLFSVQELVDLDQSYPKQLRNCDKSNTSNGMDNDDYRNHPTYQKFLKLSYPVIAKARIGVSPVTKDAEKDLKCNAHRIRFIPSPDLIMDNIDLSEDWMLQEYIPHSGEVHKVYVLGQHVFSTVNDSIPVVTSSKPQEAMHFLSRELSKNVCPDQSSGSKFGELYQQLSQNLRRLFDFSCFGYDLIFDENDPSKGYILDINYLPSYKSVDNFTSLFWGFVLDQYYGFISQHTS